MPYSPDAANRFQARITDPRDVCSPERVPGTGRAGDAVPTSGEEGTLRGRALPGHEGGTGRTRPVRLLARPVHLHEQRAGVVRVTPVGAVLDEREPGVAGLELRLVPRERDVERLAGGGGARRAPHFPVAVFPAPKHRGGELPR